MVIAAIAGTLLAAFAGASIWHVRKNPVRLVGAVLIFAIVGACVYAMLRGEFG
jgi:sugar phosphate permease